MGMIMNCMNVVILIAVLGIVFSSHVHAKTAMPVHPANVFHMEQYRHSPSLTAKC